MERVHVVVYQTNSWEYVVYSQFIDEFQSRRLVDMLLKRGKIWFWIRHLFHLRNEETHSDELVNYIEKFIDSLMEIYAFIIE